MKKSMVSVITTLMGAAAGAGAVTYKKIKRQESDFKVIKKNEAILKMFNQWLMLKQEGKTIEKYFVENGFHRIAVYGMSYAGERLIDDLKGTEIEVAYGIDRNADRIFSEVEIVNADDTLQSVDAVVVTAIYNFDEIEEKLSELMDCPIISLEDVIYEI
jgi:hypothetical protein